ncbi:MAG: 1-deoxy-D-xylulose-5-phosphate reductoisomerase [Acidimicrobiales bacterium]
MTTIAVLGSTGSIGTQTFDVVRAERDRCSVVAVAAGTNVELVVEQVNEFGPKTVVMATQEAAAQVSAAVGDAVDVGYGPEALADAARLGDVTVNGVVGFAGLPVTLATLESGGRLALANKESLIAAGPVVQRARATPGAEILPVDSEHCALHQCLRSNEALAETGRPDRVSRLLLTASGGPFRTLPRSEMANITVDDALDHPTWSMGPKITVDSSTLMNKGLEVIEAHELYGTAYDQIEVIVHPQSIVHSMVEFSDGATMAQLSLPDMRMCIGYALAYPDRLTTAFGRIDWQELSTLEFGPPDLEAFPCLALAYEAGRTGETAPAWLNAANEVAVDAFLDGVIPWLGIPDLLDRVLQQFDGTSATSADVVYDIDRRAREATRALLRSVQ